MHVLPIDLGPEMRGGQRQPPQIAARDHFTPADHNTALVTNRR
jgi:hypothetical protein